MKLLVMLFFAAIATTHAIAQKESPVSHRAQGSFEVKMAPLTPYIQEDATLGRMSIEKQFHGDLEATAKGEMLHAGKPPTGGYVAIEKVSGKLNGLSGTFVLQHTAIIDQGKPNMSIIVVPGSGTGELAGITGKMDVVIENGKHSFVLDYTLP